MAQISRWLSRIVWTILVIGAAGCSVIVISDAASTPASYTTGYDGTDPGSCALGANEAPIVPHGQATLLGDNSRPIGVIRLRRSLKCDTTWAQLVLTNPAAKELKGRVVEIIVRRPADNRIAPYPLPLRGGTIGYGNQIGATACIEGEAQLVAGQGRPGGPEARTPCV